ncbi:hypothetical protein V8D89_001459 [Ganoderma adspersum]
MATLAQEVYGPLFIGVMFNIMLYGVMFTQTYLYFNMYKDDHAWIKVFVFTLFALDAINTAFDITIIYIPLIDRFGDVALQLSWQVCEDVADSMRFTESNVPPIDPVLTGVIAALVQLFFAWRVKVLTSNRVIVALIVVLAIIQLFGGTGTTVAVSIVPQYTEFRRWKSIAIVWLVSAGLADILITATLVWHLRKNKTGMSITDDLINRIIALTVQTGLITALFAMLDLILYLNMASGWHLMSNVPLAKLYTNSLMSTLNCRRVWKASSNADRSFGPPVGSGQRHMFNVNVARGDGGIRSSRAPERIIIGVEQHEMTDVDLKSEPYPSATSVVSADLNKIESESPVSSV